MSTRPGARGLRQHQLVSRERSYLHEREQYQQQDREQQRELDRRRTALGAPTAHCPPPGR